MSNFIYLIPTLLVLFGAIALLFMSMYEKISVKVIFLYLHYF